MKLFQSFLQMQVALLLFSSVGFYQNGIAQKYRSGIYSNLVSPAEKMIFYTTNGTHYVVAKEQIREDEEGKKIKRMFTYGVHRFGSELNYEQGPFFSYGRDGFFFRRNGNEYYFDDLMAQYSVDLVNNPQDSIQFMYIKDSDLPAGWELTPENRIGELGVINKEIIYEIIKISEVKKLKVDGSINCFLIKGERGPENNGEYLIKESDYAKLNIAKNGYMDIHKLKGMTVQLYFNWIEGYRPGFISEEKMTVQNNKSTIPYDIEILNKSMNAASPFRYPMPNSKL
ncbi:MAG: hypothetical protein FJX92_01605 [Bacteroidetes bacterium]|nr:hypothetical protein [Bacteroidota bacterium]